MTVTVRPATPADASAIAEAHVLGWQVAYRGIVPSAFLDRLDVAERTEQWAAILRGEVIVDAVPRPNDHVAELDGEVVGFADVGRFRDEPDDASLGELWAMYVHPTHWNAGAGAALMAETIDDFHAAGFARAHLWVLSENWRAQRFYRSHGWTDDGVTKHFDLEGTTLTESRWSLDLRP